MIKIRILNNQSLLEAGRDDFGYYDPYYQEIEQKLSKSPYPLQTLDWCCAIIKNGVTPKKEEYSYEYSTGDALIIKVANVTNTGLDLNKDKQQYVPDEIFKRIGARGKVYLGDVLILCAAHQRIYIGKKVDIITSLPEGLEHRAMAVAELLILRARPKRIDPYYLLACLRLPIVQELITKYVRGQTGHLYPTDLKKLQIPVPEDLNLQRAIAQTVYSFEKQMETIRKNMLETQGAANEKLLTDILVGFTDKFSEVSLPKFTLTPSKTEQLSMT